MRKLHKFQRDLGNLINQIQYLKYMKKMLNYNFRQTIQLNQKYGQTF